MLVEITAKNGLTHESRMLKRGDVVEADARLMELAEPGHLHLGEQVCRPYDPARTQAEAEEERRRAELTSLPSREVMEAAADHYGVVLLSRDNWEWTGQRLHQLESDLKAAQEALADELELSNDRKQSIDELKARVDQLESERKPEPEAAPRKRQK